MPAFPEKRFTKRLIKIYLSFKSSNKEFPFSDVCNRWLQSAKQNIQKEQYRIDMINAIYDEFRKLGEDKFIEKYDLKGWPN